MPEINLPTKTAQDNINTTLDSVNTKINTINTDVTSVKSKTDSIFSTTSSMNSSVNSIYNTVNTINSKVGTTSSASSGVIKRIQRGHSYNNSNITISTVDTSKCVVILYGIGYEGNPAWRTVTGLNYDLTSTMLNVYTTSQNGDSSVDWQIIEFN